MKKVLSFCILALLFVFTKSNAQPVSSYGFTALSGTYTSNSGGTAIGALGDDILSPAYPIGFNFNFGGVVYTQFKACSNGFITFNTASTSTSLTNSEANLGTIRPGLMWLWDDLSGAATTATSSYLLTGTTPNRVLTIEMNNWRWNYSSAYDPTISVQVKLYETTNIIEYIYRQEVGTGNTAGSSGATIGLVDASTYININNSSTAPVASSTAFTTNISTRPATGQIYRWTPPGPCNASTVYPSSAGTSLQPNTMCTGGQFTATMTPNGAMPAVTGLTYQWQFSTLATGPWNNVGTPTTTMTYSGVGTQTGYYRAVTLCQGTPTTFISTPALLTVNGPSAPTTQGDLRCGPGTLTLTANSTFPIKWYENPTGGNSIATGSSFVTPYLTTTTTYYAAASEPGGIKTEQLGTGTGTLSGNPNPYYTLYYGHRNQYLIPASELNALGFFGGNFTAIGFDVVANSGLPLTNFTIKIGATNLTTMPATWQGGLTQVYTTAVYNPVANSINTHTFQTPFNWDGVSNLIIETCFNNTNWSSGHSVRYTSGHGYNCGIYGYADNSTVCTGTTPYTTTDRPNIIFTGAVDCESVRVPTVASISTPPVVTADHPSVICNDVKHPITITSNLANYNTYIWSSNIAGSLYTDINATMPYTGGSVTNLYFRSTIPGLHRVVVASTNTSNLCFSSDTFDIWVQPDGVSIIGDPDTICISGESDLVLSNTNYAPGSVQWQSSPDGINYTNINGATGTSYSTPTLTTGSYYRVIVNSDDGECMNSPVKYVHVIDPQISSVIDGFTCGAGTVTLQAFSQAGTVINWFDVPSGGLSLDTGSTFITPPLTSTTTYYASAIAGEADANIQVGTGTTVSAGTSAGPFNVWYRRSSIQLLYTASDILASGGGAGKIITMAFNCVQPPTYTFANYNISITTVPSTMTNLVWQPTTSFTPIFNAATYMPTTGWQTINFSVPFDWNGVDNIVFYLCWDYTPGGISSVGGTHEYTTTSGRFLYNWTDATGNSCGVTGASTSTMLPNLKLDIKRGCEGDRVPVIAYVHEKPDVDLGPDMNKCVDPGHLEFLNAVNFGSDYLWDNNYNGMVRVINSSGTYWVQVTNQYGCTDSDTINVTFKPNPLVDLGNDTTVCNGVSLTLDGGNDGIQYYWNTGQTTPSINIKNPGTYSVQVTGENGCVKIDSITVNMQGQLPTSGGIMVNNHGPYTFSFTPVNPLNIIGYQWSFGDGNYSNQPSPVHTYNAIGNYVVTLNLMSICGYSTDSVSTHIYTKIDDLNFANGSVIIYPNPTKDNATITCKDGVIMKSVKLMNVMGQVILHDYVGAPDKHELNLSGIASGMYNVEIETDKGIVTKKLEIVK